MNEQSYRCPICGYERKEWGTCPQCGVRLISREERQANALLLAQAVGLAFTERAMEGRK